jgi:hypothetical protein
MTKSSKPSERDRDIRDPIIGRMIQKFSVPIALLDFLKAEIDNALAVAREEGRQEITSRARRESRKEKAP